MGGRVLRLGRNPDNDIVVPVQIDGVSRYHASIQVHAGGGVIQDHGSANGTWVNGRRISGPTPITPHDQVRLGASYVVPVAGLLGQAQAMPVMPAAPAPYMAPVAQPQAAFAHPPHAPLVPVKPQLPGVPAVTGVPTASAQPGYTDCPVCGEPIRSTARKCKHCGEDIAQYQQAIEDSEEHLVFEGHPAMFTSGWQIVGLVVPMLTLLALTVLLSQNRGGDEVAGVIIATCIAIVAIMVGRLFWYWWKARSTHYKITTHRIVYRRGILSSRVDTVEAFRIDDITLAQPFCWKLLGHSIIHVTSSDRTLPQMRIYGIPDIFDVSEQLRESVFRQRKHRRMNVHAKA